MLVFRSALAETQCHTDTIHFLAAVPPTPKGEVTDSSSTFVNAVRSA
jgi:hypothetical protein